MRTLSNAGRDQGKSAKFQTMMNSQTSTHSVLRGDRTCRQGGGGVELSVRCEVAVGRSHQRGSLTGHKTTACNTGPNTTNTNTST